MSQFDPQPVDPFGTPPKKRGMSTGAKVAIILVVVFGGFGVLCCGAVGALFYWGSQSFINDPKQVVAKKDEMVQIDIPAQLKPVGAVDMKVPFSDQRIMTMVIYGDNAGSTLMLGSFEMAGEGQQGDMQRTMEQSLQKQRKNGKQQNLVVRETRVKTVTIRGEEVEFSVQRGTAGGQPRVRVNGEFPGASGTVVLMLDADPNTVPEEDIDRMLESIK